MNSTDVYETERLILKVLDAGYCCHVLHFLASNKELFELYERDKPVSYYTPEYHMQILNYEASLIKKGLHLRLYVFLKSNPDKIIGTVSFSNFRRFPSKSCEIGYKFDSACHHHGYALESVKKALGIILTEFNMTRIKAYIQPSNTPSVRLIESAGFKQKELIRKYALIQGAYRDHYLYIFDNQQ